MATPTTSMKLSVLKLCFRDDLETDTFHIRLVDNSCFPFTFNESAGMNSAR